MPSLTGFGHHDEADDYDQNRQHHVKIKPLICFEQRRTDAAAADKTHHGRIPQVGVEQIGGKASEARQHRGLHTHDQHAQKPRPRGADGLDLFGRGDFLSPSVANELGDEAGLMLTIKGP